MRSHDWLLILGMLSLAACRTRDPDALGLLDAPVQGEEFGDDEAGIDGGEARQEVVAADGNWQIQCSPADQQAGDTRSYQLVVRGAIRPDDELQPLLVNIKVERAGQATVLGEDEMGRGAVDPQGAIFVGSAAGVLTAEYRDKGERPMHHQGVITLAKDKDADALAVFCKVDRIKAGSSF